MPSAGGLLSGDNAGSEPAEDNSRVEVDVSDPNSFMPELGVYSWV